MNFEQNIQNIEHFCHPKVPFDKPYVPLLDLHHECGYMSVFSWCKFIELHTCNTHALITHMPFSEFVSTSIKCSKSMLENFWLNRWPIGYKMCRRGVGDEL